MNGTLAFSHALLICFIAFQEFGNVATVVIDECPACLDVEHPFRGIFLCYLLSFVEQPSGFLRIIVQLHVDQIHVDRWHTLVIACFLHHADHGVEVALGCVLVAAVTVDMPQHVVGHVHFLIEAFLAQFDGKLTS